MLPTPRPPLTERRKGLWALSGVLALAAPGMLAAQQIEGTPSLRFGVSTGVVAHDNRALDADSAGSTIEYFTQLDFGATFATPIQQFELSGNVSLRHVNGAEREALDSGLVEPTIALSYGRQARDAQFSAGLRHTEIDVSSSNLVDIIGVPDPALVSEQGTRRSTVFDTELELRRRAPFGITLSAGHTALRYSDAVASSLSDQDRFSLGTRLRFDINPATRATLGLRYSTFEDFGTPEGVRETFQLDGTLRQELTNGDVSLNFGATDTEDGERYTLSAGRSLNTPLWTLRARLGLTQDIQGGVLPEVNLDMERELRNGAFGASFGQRVASGIDDTEQKITSVSVSYDTQLNALTSFNTFLTYNETDPTGAGNTSSVGSAGFGLQRDLTRDLQLDVDFSHRISESVTGLRARDNRLSLTLRRELLGRR